jgi:hypothetical protein
MKPQSLSHTCVKSHRFFVQKNHILWYFVYDLLVIVESSRVQLSFISIQLQAADELIGCSCGVLYM